MMTVKTVTIDTNLLPADDLIEIARQKGINVAVVSVTKREMGYNDPRHNVAGLGEMMETAVWGESMWGNSVWGGEADGHCFESVLQIISNGSFPKLGDRDHLTDGQRRQMRDAMILCAHARDGREMFVTEDRKAFIDNGRRSALEALLKTSILTRVEFLDHLQGIA